MARTNTKTAEQRNAEREALLATLEDKVTALANSTEWLTYLKFLTAFRQYRTSTI